MTPYTFEQLDTLPLDKIEQFLSAAFAERPPPTDPLDTARAQRRFDRPRRYQERR